MPGEVERRPLVPAVRDQAAQAARRVLPGAASGDIPAGAVGRGDSAMVGLTSPHPAPTTHDRKALAVPRTAWRGPSG